MGSLVGAGTIARARAWRAERSAHSIGSSAASRKVAASGALVTATVAAVLLWLPLFSYGSDGAAVTDGTRIEEAAHHNAKGIARMARKEWGRAEDEFRQTVRLAPEIPCGTTNLALALLAGAKGEEAERVLRDAAKRWDALPAVHALAGQVLWEANQKEQAVTELQRAVALEADPHTLYALARRMSFLGRHGAAAAVLEKVAGDGAVRKAALLDLGEESLLAGRMEEGVSAYEQAVRGTDSDRAELNGYLSEAKALLVAGNKEKALQQMRFFSNILKTHESIRHEMRILSREPFLIPRHVFAHADAARAASCPGETLFTPRSDIFARKVPGETRWDGGCVLDSGKEESRVALVGPDGTSIFAFKGDAWIEQARLPTGGTRCLAGDLDRDGDADLLVVGSDQSQLVENDNGRWTRKPIPGLKDGRLRGGREAVFLDYDGDGDIDILVVSPELHLYRNGGDWSFQEVSDRAGLTGAGEVEGLLAADVDDDGDSDLFLWKRGLPNRLLAGTSVGKFEDLSELLGGELGASGPSVVADLDADGDLDICAATGGGDLVLALNDGAGLFKREAAPLRFGGGRAVQALGAVDLDGDSSPDLIGIAGGKIAFLKGTGEGHFADATAALVGKLPEGVYKGAVTLDADRDGHPDLLLLRAGAPPLFLRNQCGNKTTWASLAVHGVMDNPDGLGAKIDIYAGAMRYRHSFSASTATIGWSAPHASIGLGSRKGLDWLKVSWPNGLWDEREDVEARVPLRVEQTVRMMGSCPFLYGWNGARYAFAGEILVASPLGLPLTADRRSSLKGDEYLQLEDLKPRGNRYVLKLTNELHEIAYIDKAALAVVDHPSDIRVVGSEKFQLPPYDPFKLYGIRKAIPPRKALDRNGADVTELLLESDGRYPAPSGPTRYPGLGDEYAVELDFGPLDDGPRAALFLNGAFKWFEVGSFTASQGLSARVEPPVLQVRSADGQWITALANMGMPGGRRKTIAVDLTGHFASDDHRVRIVTNVLGYWDQAFAATDLMPLPDFSQRLSPVAADLHSRGHSRLVPIQILGSAPLEYSDLSASAPFSAIPGAYTRLGDVVELLGETDDRYVIMAPGDEISLEFDASTLAPLPPGHQRTLFFYSAGWSKDASQFTAFSDGVEPLPFRGMSGYPYGPGETYPTDERHADYKRIWNTRVITP